MCRKEDAVFGWRGACCSVRIVDCEELLDAVNFAVKKRRDALVVRGTGEWGEVVPGEDSGAEKFGAGRDALLGERDDGIRDSREECSYQSCW